MPALEHRKDDPASLFRTASPNPPPELTMHLSDPAHIGQSDDGRTRVPSLAADSASSLFSYWTETQVLATSQTGGRTPEFACSPWGSTNKAQTDDIQYNNQALNAVSRAVAEVLKLKSKKYDSVAIILRQCAQRNVRDASHVAYILATAEHESHLGNQMVERRNEFTEAGQDYRLSGFEAKLHTPGGGIVKARTLDQLEFNYWNAAYGTKLGNRPGTADASNFRGRGFVQLTGRANYEMITKMLNEQGFSYVFENTIYGGGRDCSRPIDLITNYEHVNKVPELAARIMVTGMESGKFTGESLSDHVNSESVDFYNARSVINVDKNYLVDPKDPNNKQTIGEKIAESAKSFLSALTDWPIVFVLGKADNYLLHPK